MSTSYVEPKKIFESEFDKINNELKMKLMMWRQRSSNRPEFKF